MTVGSWEDPPEARSPLGARGVSAPRMRRLELTGEGRVREVLRNGDEREMEWGDVLRSHRPCFNNKEK